MLHQRRRGNTISFREILFSKELIHELKTEVRIELDNWIKELKSLRKVNLFVGLSSSLQFVYLIL